MEFVFGILFIGITFAAIVLYGKAKGAPEPSAMTDADIAYRLSTENAWISKFHRLPNKSDSLKRMYEEKTIYVDRLNQELKSRYPQEAFEAIENELKPILHRANELSAVGVSVEQAISASLKEWVGDVSEESAISSSIKESTSNVEKKRYEIHAGIGLPECSIGMPVEHFQKLFGGEYTEIPFLDSKTIFISSKGNGISARIEEGKIGAMFFFFSSKTYSNFSGETDRGIGRYSSIDSVITIYGDPDEIDKLYDDDEIDEFDVQETSLCYNRLGIKFTFENNTLVDIRCLRSRQ